MKYSYFLGANTPQGFFSLYGEYPRSRGAYLHVIKAGPGGGKSTFLRTLSAAAQERGLDVEEIRCSGDPDSLDGVLIPALGQMWVDGTAPHITEPGAFGADFDYVPLGQFCRTPLSPADRERCRMLTAAYRAAYAQGAALLANRENPAENKAVINARQLFSLLPPGREGDRPGETEKIFLSALTGQGRLRDESIFRARPWALEEGLTEQELSALSREAVRRGLRTILCLMPEAPACPEALLLPETGQGYLAASLPAGDSEREVPAYSRFAEALALHNELEAVYRPYLDLPALRQFTTDTVSAVFSAEG